jgi:glycosyltransferase involved in cell wall biosynthesis
MTALGKANAGGSARGPVCVSVAVPVRNEESTLPVLLDALLGQSHAPDEIVISDGGSTDRTVAVARRYGLPVVRVIELGSALPGRGRNKAIEAARNDWVALIDAGCVPRQNWIEELVNTAGLSGGQAIFGQYEARIVDEWDIAQSLTTLPPIDPKTGCRPPSIASAVVHRSAWKAVGGFPENLRAAEDLVFFARLEAAGIATARSPGAIVRWSLAPGPRAYFKRLRLYAEHHAAAGLWRTWQLRVMLMDLSALMLATAGIAYRAALALCLSGAVARLLWTVWERRCNVEGINPYRPDRLARVGLLLLLADVATWLGTWDHVWGRWSPR